MTRIFKAEYRVSDKKSLKDLKTYKKIIPVKATQLDYDFVVETLMGTMNGKKGDYICAGLNDEMWPIKKLTFEKTYEEIKVQCQKN